jgi:DNA adenine methylase
MAIRRRNQGARQADQPTLFPTGCGHEANGCGDGLQANSGLLPKSISKTIVPPIKCQGIKTKLVSFIANAISWSGNGRWIEPFLGSGVVLFTLCPERAIITDTNKHLISVYLQIQAGTIHEAIVRDYLEEAGKNWLRRGLTTTTR